MKDNVERKQRQHWKVSALECPACCRPVRRDWSAVCGEFGPFHLTLPLVAKHLSTSGSIQAAVAGNTDIIIILVKAGFGCSTAE